MCTGRTCTTDSWTLAGNTSSMTLQVILSPNASPVASGPWPNWINRCHRSEKPDQSLPDILSHDIIRLQTSR